MAIQVFNLIFSNDVNAGKFSSMIKFPNMIGFFLAVKLAIQRGQWSLDWVGLIYSELLYWVLC